MVLTQNCEKSEKPGIDIDDVFEYDVRTKFCKTGEQKTAESVIDTAPGLSIVFTTNEYGLQVIRELIMTNFPTSASSRCRGRSLQLSAARRAKHTSHKRFNTKDLLDVANREVGRLSRLYSLKLAARRVVWVTIRSSTVGRKGAGRTKRW